MTIFYIQEKIMTLQENTVSERPDDEVRAAYRNLVARMKANSCQAISTIKELKAKFRTHKDKAKKARWDAWKAKIEFNGPAELKFKGEMIKQESVVTSLRYRHVETWRPQARVAHLAYGFARGRPYRDMERTTSYDSHPGDDDDMKKGKQFWRKCLFNDVRSVLNDFELDAAGLTEWFGDAIEVEKAKKVA